MSVCLPELRLHSVLETLRNHPADARVTLVKTQPTATAVKEFFQPCLSDVDNPNRREKEELVVYNFYRFIDQVGSKLKEIGTSTA